MKKNLFLFFVFSFFLCSFFVSSVFAVGVPQLIQIGIPDSEQYYMPYYQSGFEDDLNQFFNNSQFYGFSFDYIDGTGIYKTVDCRSSWVGLQDPSSLNFMLDPSCINSGGLANVSIYLDTGEHLTLFINSTGMLKVTRSVGNIFELYNFVIYAYSYQGNTREIALPIRLFGTGEDGQFPSSSWMYPQQIKDFSSIDLRGGLSYAFDMNDYVRNYNSVSISWVDSYYGPISIFRSKSSSLDTSCFPTDVLDTYADFQVCLTPSLDNVLVSFYPTFKNNVTNDFVQLSFDNYYSSLGVVVSVLSSDGWQVTDYRENQTAQVSSSSIVGYIAGLFDAIFPPSSALYTKQKFSYVLITMFIIDLIIVITLFKTKNVKLISYLIVFMDVLAGFYFIAIGYIPVSVLILLLLLLVGLIWLRSKSGGN